MQLYNKRTDQEARVKSKIESDSIDANLAKVNNLCGYIDIGFSITCSGYSNMQNNPNIDLSTIREKVGNNVFSISRVGSALMFTIGEIAQTDDSESNPLFAAGLHDYLVVYNDCSASLRILLFANEDENKVDISVIPIVTEMFKSIYRKLCGDDFYKIFVHAQKYESIKVLKQFVPVYEMSRHFGDDKHNPFKNVLQEHRAKYGENLIIQKNRIPVLGYELIDKQWFDKYKIKYNQMNLIEELFGSAYTHLGYIDQIKMEE